MKIFCFGDSNTFGFDPRSYFGERYQDTVRWTGLLSHYGWKIVEKGMNGREIPHTAHEMEMAGLELKDMTASDRLLVMLGGNDLLNNRGMSAEQAADRMREFILALMPCCRITILVPPKMQIGSWTAEDPRVIVESERLSEAYRRISEELSVGFLDTAGISFPMCSDGVHLLPEGHKMLANLLNDYYSPNSASNDQTAAMQRL